MAPLWQGALRVFWDAWSSRLPGVSGTSRPRGRFPVLVEGAEGGQGSALRQAIFCPLSEVQPDIFGTPALGSETITARLSPTARAPYFPYQKKSSFQKWTQNGGERGETGRNGGTGRQAELTVGVSRLSAPGYCPQGVPPPFSPVFPHFSPFFSFLSFLSFGNHRALHCQVVTLLGNGRGASQRGRGGQGQGCYQGSIAVTC